MGLRTGMLGSLGYYIHGENKFEATESTPDAVAVQRLMAKMVHNGTEAVVMEASSHGLATGRCNEVDFDIAIFTNLKTDDIDFTSHKNEMDYRNNMGKLFERMVDPERHRKIVNIDDPNASYFIAQGNLDVPIVTYAMNNENADVYPLKFELSLFETRVLVQTPKGMLEISSGLLGSHNIYNILAAVAVGITVGAPLEDVVRGIEEVDAIPGRCELIDEEQAFWVSLLYENTNFTMDFVASTMSLDDIQWNRVDILDDMLAGVGWSMQDYLKFGENDYYPSLPNGHRLFLHDIRRVAVRAAVAMGEEADIVEAELAKSMNIGMPSTKQWLVLIGYLEEATRKLSNCRLAVVVDFFDGGVAIGGKLLPRNGLSFGETDRLLAATLWTVIKAFEVDSPIDILSDGLACISQRYGRDRGGDEFPGGCSGGGGEVGGKFPASQLDEVEVQAFRRKKKAPRSKIAISVKQNADPSCHIWFVCKGNLICTREADISFGLSQSQSCTPNSEFNSSPISIQSEQLSRTLAQGKSGNSRFLETSNQIFWNIASSGMLGFHEAVTPPRITYPSPDKTSSPESRCTFGRSIAANSSEKFSLRSLKSSCCSSSSGYEEEVLSNSDFQSVKDEESEVGLILDHRLHVSDATLKLSQPHQLEEGGIDVELYQILKDALREAERIKHEAYEESLRRQRAERDATDAIRESQRIRELFMSKRSYCWELASRYAKKLTNWGLDDNSFIPATSLCPISQEVMKDRYIAAGMASLMREKR
ncbi:hypothetical protein HPP92_008284 [Vanilla planifolia]|uniref:Mur ligase central domain-containing protein n=1 Tax=Vanilla planifolia TaxID=51239 RepID=A0A835V3M0_VANPL|nr:hypothetical protein HPP92_008284 [Vanilla planifolia]